MTIIIKVIFSRRIIVIVVFNSFFFSYNFQLNVHQRSLEAAGLELCAASGSVPQGQPSSAGSVGSAPSPASPRPTPQSRAPLVTISSQPSRTLDDDRSTDGNIHTLLILYILYIKKKKTNQQSVILFYHFIIIKFI